MATPHLAALCLPLFLVACGDLELRSIRSPEVVPAQLEGEWSGSWHSSSTTDSGPLVVRLQEFAGQPVVSLQIVNPCVQMRAYELVLGLSSVELRAEGDPVFVGVLGEGRTLVGGYDCNNDVGSWTATWQRDLAPLIDLSGRWSGTLATAGALPRLLTLQLEQTVREGMLALDGALTIDGIGPEPVRLPLVGTANFRSDGFDLALRSPDGSAPNVVMSGLGESMPLQVELGVLQVLGASALPFTQGVFRIEWQQR